MSMETSTPAAERQIEWEPQRRMTLDAARRRSGVVKLLRFTFIVLAVLIIGVVIAYIVMSAQTAPAPPVVAEQPAEEIKEDEIRIEKPRFEGRDDAGRPYLVEAESAVRRPEGGDVTDLVFPQLDTDPESNSNMQVTADRGVYDADNKTLDLYKQVQLQTPDGYVYETSHAKFLISEDRILGQEEVVGVGPVGTIRADGYEIAQGGERVYFNGRVQTRIHQKSSQTGE